MVSFVVTEGGRALNVIPARTRAEVELRAESVRRLRRVRDRVRARLEAGALATGTHVDITPRAEEFADLRQDRRMSQTYVRAPALAGAELARDPEQRARLLRGAEERSLMRGGVREGG